MSMKALDELRDKLCEALDEIAHKNDMGAGDLEVAHKLTDTIKNIDKIMMLEGDDGYSQGGEWEARGDYGNGNSYANRGKHYVRGHYSRDGEMSMARRDDRGRYSRDGGRDNMIRKLRDMMDDAATDQERSAIRRCIEQMEND